MAKAAAQTLKTPLSHPVAQWLVVGALLLSLAMAWSSCQRSRITAGRERVMGDPRQHGKGAPHAPAKAKAQ